jgi:hypothetical protein
MKSSLCSKDCNQTKTRSLTPLSSWSESNTLSLTSCRHISEHHRSCKEPASLLSDLSPPQSSSGIPLCPGTTHSPPLPLRRVPNFIDQLISLSEDVASDLFPPPSPLSLFSPQQMESLLLSLGGRPRFQVRIDSAIAKGYREFSDARPLFGSRTWSTRFPHPLQVGLQLLLLSL